MKRVTKAVFGPWHGMGPDQHHGIGRQGVVMGGEIVGRTAGEQELLDQTQGFRRDRLHICPV